MLLPNKGHHRGDAFRTLCWGVIALDCSPISTGKVGRIKWWRCLISQKVPVGLPVPTRLFREYVGRAVCVSSRPEGEKYNRKVRNMFELQRCLTGEDSAPPGC